MQRRFLVNAISRMMDSVAGRWTLLTSMPVLALILGQFASTADQYLLAGLALAWVLAAVFMFWGSSKTRALNAALAERDAAMMELEEALGQIRESARNDPLTGAANQRFLYEILRQEWARAERTGSPLSMVLTEFDGFEAYVDRLGDHAGDKLLRQAAEIIAREIKRPGDLLARLGGKRFVVLLPDTDLDGAGFIAQRLCQNMELQCAGDGPQDVTLSAGVAVRMPSIQSSESELLEVARLCLAAAKRAGGNRVITQQQLD
jgi:diguanylate cyclase (GGDEF)-like protein